MRKKKKKIKIVKETKTTTIENKKKITGKKEKRSVLSATVHFPGVLRGKS